MRRARFLPALLVGVLAAALPAAALDVKSVTVSVAPAASKGPCPVKFTFTGKVVLSKEGHFTYRWERSDGAIDTLVHPPVAFDGVHPAVVSETWTLGAATPAFHPFHGWVKLHVLTPQDRLSAPATFTLDCGGAPTGYPPPCNGKADLVPILHTPMDGWVAVKNNGPGSAGPSQLLVKCTRVGYPAPGGGCPVTPAALPAPFFVGPGGGASMVVGVNVPPIACGATVAFPMPFWANVSWSKGTYTFTATADSANAVAETNEGNNVVTSTLVK